MKKSIVLTLLILASILVWWNRMALTWFAYEWRDRPEKPKFLSFEQDRIQIHYVPSAFYSQNLKSIASKLQTNLTEAEKEIGSKLPSPLIVYLYNNWEEKGRHVKEISVAHADPDENILYCIANDQMDGTRERLEFQLLLRHRYGAAASAEWARDTAAALGGFWNEKSLEDWVRFLLARNLLPQFPAYWQDTESYSQYLVHPWNSSLAKFIYAKYGKEAFISLYRTGRPPQNYEEQWTSYLRTLQSEITPLDRPAFQPQFQKGMSYAYANGYDSGYATKISEQSLSELQNDNVQWVAAIPYGFMRSDSQENIGFAGHHIAGESDESMLALSQELKRRKMKMMLKPQIWVHNGSWTGRIDFNDDAGWQRWFKSYENWIVHYAILAEQLDADIFCIGTELVQSTLKHPELWRNIIARVRQIYHGPIVYAANHGKEFEELTFWGDLDYIGLDNYYAVRNDPSQNVEAMKKEFALQKEKLFSIAQRYNKPLLFTEIGYMANNAAGMGPREYDFSDYDEKMQAECYRMALETYWNEPWFAGMYWWKWFSDPRDRGKRADPHSPHGREAEKIIAEWYKKPRQSPYSNPNPSWRILVEPVAPGQVKN